MAASPNWSDGHFANALPQRLFLRIGIAEFFGGSDYADPAEPVAARGVPPSRFHAPPESGLRVTWLGHSTTLIEIDGHTLLTDPVWGPRTSPVSWAGPARWYDPLIALSDLPPVDAVLISHDHYDHLDYPTILAIRDWDTDFIVPLGVGAHLEKWGVPPERIVELDWWERYTVGEVDIVSTPARHASGRHFFDRDRTLWAGYAVLGAEHRVFFSGDTGMFDGLREIGDRLGPFDLTMVEVGAYSQSWPDWHLGPEQAVQAHQMLRGDVLLPIHWGLFNLSSHGWTEPIERVLVAADAAGVRALAPQPGDSFEPGVAAPLVRWWPDRPWNTASEYPVVSKTGNEPD